MASEASLGNLGESAHERGQRSQVNQHMSQQVLAPEGLTFSFLPLYGFFTNSMASTMSSVIVRYFLT